MREAGFTEEEIARWEKSATHPSRSFLGKDRDDEARNIKDVKWKPRGEEREWDVGKVVEKDAPSTTSSGREEGKEEDGTEEHTSRTERKRKRKRRVEIPGKEKSSLKLEPQNREQLSRKPKPHHHEKPSASNADASSAWLHPRNGLLKQFKMALG